MGARIPMLTGRVPVFRAQTAPTAPKTAASIYHTPEYRAWREIVITRAGRQCEALVNGRRCRKAEPAHRMFADHKVEVKDGGDLHDPANGECLCGAHHSAKTAKARAARHRA